MDVHVCSEVTNLCCVEVTGMYIHMYVHVCSEVTNLCCVEVTKP